MESNQFHMTASETLEWASQYLPSEHPFKEFIIEEPNIMVSMEKQDLERLLKMSKGMEVGGFSNLWEFMDHHCKVHFTPWKGTQTISIRKELFGYFIVIVIFLL